MKKTLAIIGIALFTYVGAGGQGKLTTFSDSTKSFQLTFREFSIENRPGPVYHFELTNPGGMVHAISKKQQIEFFAPRMEVDAASMKGKGADYIRSATATGGIRTIRTGAGGRAEMTGSVAKYAATDGKATLTIGGPVKMTNSSPGGQGFVATGSSLVADLGNANSRMTFQTATLNGPVHLTIKRAASAGQQVTDLRISAHKMVLDQATKPATITLSGGVNGSGFASGMSVDSALSRVVLTLNDSGEVVRTVGTGDQP